jgi:hypothetical protein
MVWVNWLTAQNVVRTVSAETCDGAGGEGRTLGEAAGAPLEADAFLAAGAPFVGGARFACVTLLSGFLDASVGVGGAPNCARAAPGSNMASNSSSARRTIAPALTTSIA